jgi:hypothetical protein
MNAWCHGTEGISLALQSMSAPHIHAGIDEVMLSDDAVAGLSLCHGEAGRMLWHSIRAESNSPYRSAHEDAALRYERSLVDAFSEPRTIGHSPLAAWDNGLMTGRAGVLWALSFRELRELPNPLLLTSSR